MTGDDDQARVNLADREEGGCGVARDGLSEEPAVAEDGFAGVLGGKAKIQFGRGTFRSVGGGDAAATGAEAVPEPGNLVPAGDGNPLNAVGGCNWLGRSGAESVRGCLGKGARPGMAGGTRHPFSLAGKEQPLVGGGAGWSKGGSRKHVGLPSGRPA